MVPLKEHINLCADNVVHVALIYKPVLKRMNPERRMVPVCPFSVSRIVTGADWDLFKDVCPDLD